MVFRKSIVSAISLVLELPTRIRSRKLGMGVLVVVVFRREKGVVIRHKCVW
jgi:hypothetical protein